MIELELTKGEAILVLELIKHGTDELIAQLTDALDEENTSEKMEKAAGENYVVNLEREVERLTKLLAEQQAPIEKVPAPYGYKKDGTPKKIPGRPAKKGIK